VYNYISLKIFHTQRSFAIWRKRQRCGNWEVKEFRAREVLKPKIQNFWKGKKVSGFAGNI